MKIHYNKLYPFLLASSPDGPFIKNLVIDDILIPSKELPLKYSQLLKIFAGNHKKIRSFLLKYGNDWICINGNLFFSNVIIYSK